MLSQTHRGGERGISLVESLVAVLVLSAGVCALAWTQSRQLVDGRETVARAMAVLLIQDLSNRILFNREAAERGEYLLSWGENPSAVDCHGSPCSSAALAQADLSAWRRRLGESLAHGDAHIFADPGASRRVGIAVAWTASRTVDALRDAPLAVTARHHGVDCPENRHCHVTYVPY